MAKKLAPRNQGNRNGDGPRRNAPVDTSTTNALVVQDGIGGYDWSFQAKEGITNFALMAYTSQGSSSSSSSDSEVHTCSKDCLKSYETLQKQYDQQREALNKSNLEIIGYQMGLESLEARIVVHEKNEAVYEEDIAFLKYDVQVKDISIKDLKNQLEEALKEKDDLKLKLEKFEESSKNLTKLINSQISAKDKAGLGYDSQINENEVVHSVFNSRESDVDDSPVNDRFKTGEGFHAVPPPYTGNYMPSRPDLSFAGLDDSVYKTKVSETETSISKTSKDIVEKPKTVRPSAPIIEDWDTDSDNDSVFRPKSDQTKPKFTKINFVKSDENVKSVNKENTHRQVEYPRKSQSPRDNRRNWNGLMTQKLGNGFESIKKACFVCGSFNHLIKDCDFHENKMVEKPVLNNKGRVTGQREIRPVWNNAQRVNHQNKLTHPHPKRNFIPTAVATKSGQVPVNAAKQSSSRAATLISTVRPVNTAAPKSKVNDALPITYSYFKAHSPVGKAFNQKSTAKTNNFNEKVNTARVNNVTTAGPKAVVSAAVRNGENTVKSSTCWIWRPTGNGNPQYTLQDQGIFDSGCSRNMTRNKSFLIDYQEIDGGFVAFEGSPKGGKITGKGKIRTGKLDFEDVYFVKELKFNLFSVSQMRDQKNNVLFTKTECLVLSPDFKLLDESHVLLKVPRHDNMYNFDLKNVVPSGGLTCLFAKATIDESNLCHMRLGYINFKTINKLVKGNLVRGFPSKLFENDHTCVACQKGKQHKASWIKREFSVARTPQQNGVAERKNRTLIEVARTMLADSLLPTTFGPEVITAGNQTNKNTGIKDNVDAVPTQQYILLPLLYDSLQSSKDAVADDAAKKTNEEPENKGERNDQEKEKEGYANSTDRDSIVSPSVSAVGKSFTNADDLPTDPLMPDLEDTTNLLNTGIFSGAYDDEDVGAEADLNNLETTMNVSPIPKTKIHKDHPKDQIIGDINLATQTRSMTKIYKEHAMGHTSWLLSTYLRSNSSVPDTELVLYPLQDKSTSKIRAWTYLLSNYPAYSLVSCLQGLLVVGDRMGLSESITLAEHPEGNSLNDYSLSGLEMLKRNPIRWTNLERLWRLIKHPDSLVARVLKARGPRGILEMVNQFTYEMTSGCQLTGVIFYFWKGTVHGNFSVRDAYMKGLKSIGLVSYLSDIDTQICSSLWKATIPMKITGTDGRRAIRLLQEFHDVAICGNAQFETNVDPLASTWHPPHYSFVKVNCDDAWFPSSKQAGLGFVARNLKVDDLVHAPSEVLNACGAEVFLLELNVTPDPLQQLGRNVTPDPLQQLGRNVTPDPYVTYAPKSLPAGTYT
ncbi:ribonuclease H-like domain-containing protein [Tanacetum coccineum]